MRFNVTKRELYSGFIASLILLGLAIFTLLYSPKTPTDDEANTIISEETNLEPGQVQYKQNLLNQIQFQEEVDNMLLAELESGNYSLEEPLIVLDPYNNSPLTALILFTSSEPLNITIHIPGKDELSSINYQFDGFKTEHIIPVYGLYENSENLVTLNATNKLKQIQEITFSIETQPLPEEIQNLIFISQLEKSEAYQPGLNFTYRLAHYPTNSPKSAFDVNGDIRWFFPGEYMQASNYSLNGNYLFTTGDYYQGNVYFIEMNPLGKIFKVLYAPYGAHHDIEVFQGGKILVTGTNGETVEDFIYELDLNTGEIANTLDLKTIFSRVRNHFPDNYKPSFYTSKDWIHLNTIVSIENSNEIIISGRNQSMVAKISWPDGKIEWISSPPGGFLPNYSKYLLTPIGEDFEQHFEQHAPAIMDDLDNNPDTMDILLFDNGSFRIGQDKELQRQIANHEIIEPEKYSRMVHYRINEKDKTIEQIWDYGDDYGYALFSNICGDADPLPNGNRLGMFNVGSEDDRFAATFIEVDENGNLVWMTQVTNNEQNYFGVEYRVERQEIYSDNANNLMIGESATNLIPAEVLENNEIQ
ncbi:MAG: aryl-sulfate sulfotransferase [Anaerolineaceae bacterium]|nr:aryl-sulfate sulfotransferase [Anaerolineaceae bacterium]